MEKRRYLLLDKMEKCIHLFVSLFLMFAFVSCAAQLEKERLKTRQMEMEAIRSREEMLKAEADIRMKMAEAHRLAAVAEEERWQER